MTSRQGLMLGCLCVVAMFALAGRVYAQDTAALVERLHRAIALNSIDDAAMKPWHLKISFQLLDAKGNRTETGTIEEWWAAPSIYKRVYTSPSYKSTEMQKNDALYRNKGAEAAPKVLQLILSQVVHPMPKERDFEFAVYAET